MTCDGNCHHFRRKHNCFRKDNSYSNDAAGTVPARYPGGISEVLKEEAAMHKPPSRSHTVLQSTRPVHERLRFCYPMHLCVLLQCIALTWEAAAAVAVCWETSLERSTWEAAQAAVVGKRGVASCCSFDCSLSCNKATEERGMEEALSGVERDA